MSRTVYSELRGRIVDDGAVGRRVWRNRAKNGEQIPYVEIEEATPTERPIRPMVMRTFVVRIYQDRNISRDPALPRRIRGLFHRQRWDYFEDDANTVARRVIARVTTSEEIDSPPDGTTHDEVTVLVQVVPDAL